MFERKERKDVVRTKHLFRDSVRRKPKVKVSTVQVHENT